MKYIKIFVLAMAAVMLSCGGEKESGKKWNGEKEEEEEIPIGKNEDDIKLSTKEVIFTISGGSAVVSTEGIYWWFDSFVDSDTYTGIKKILSKIGADDNVYTYDWISVSKSGRNKIIIMVESNSTGELRKIKVQVTSGDYCDYITVIQNPVEIAEY